MLMIILLLYLFRDWQELANHDQLTREVRAGRVLGNFELCPINFEPTFKRVKGEVYGFNEKRVPSYTDRICYHSLEGFRGNVRNTYFNTNTEISFSDHKVREKE